MINFDDVTGENIKKHIKIGLEFLSIHTEYQYLVPLNQEKQMR